MRVGRVKGEPAWPAQLRHAAAGIWRLAPLLALLPQPSCLALTLTPTWRQLHAVQQLSEAVRVRGGHWQVPARCMGQQQAHASG